MVDVIAQIISVTPPRGSSDWILDAQRRRAENPGAASPERPWATLDAARFAVFREFDDAFPDSGVRSAGDLRMGGTWLAQVGEAFSPVPDLRRALQELHEAAGALKPLLGRLELAAEALQPLARRDNSVRNRLAGTWLALAFRARSLVGDANVLPGDVEAALRALDAGPPMMPGITLSSARRTITTTACARLSGLARQAPALKGLLHPATLMLLEIAFEADAPFDEPSSEWDEGSDGTYKRRVKRWDKAWNEAKSASPR